MRFITITLYFIFVIVFLSSIGVSLPYIFDSINKSPDIIKNLNQNIITYIVAILVSASLDFVLKLIDRKVSYRKAGILTITILNVAVLISVSIVLYKNSNNQIKEISTLTIIGIILAYVMWWIANYRNSNFDINDATSTLGGSTDKPLTNG